MKLSTATFVFTGLMAIGAAAATAACDHPQRRHDWRAPSPPMPCTSDADCRGGVCTMERDGKQGTCTGTPAALPPLPHGDGGAPAPGQAPLPSHQPSSSDIQI